jgi:hypothetical protein
MVSFGKIITVIIPNDQFCSKKYHIYAPKGLLDEWFLTRKKGRLTQNASLPYCLKHKTLRLNAVPGATAANGTTFTTGGLSLFACPLVRCSHGMSGFPAFAGNFTLFLRTH